MVGLLMAAFLVVSAEAVEPGGEQQAVASVANGAAAEVMPADPNPTRLFFAPTGRSLKQGEATFGVYEVVMPFVQYGITDRISIGGGTPFFFGTGVGQPVWVTPKVQVLKARSTQASVGVLHLMNMGDYNAGIAYGVVTQGSADAAVTIGGGYAYSSEDESRVGAPVVMLGGEKRLSRRLKFVTENYWFSGVGLASGGLRLMGDRLSADLGLVSPLGADGFFVFPMVNVAFKLK